MLMDMPTILQRLEAVRDTLGHRKGYRSLEILLDICISDLKVNENLNIQLKVHCSFCKAEFVYPISRFLIATSVKCSQCKRNGSLISGVPESP